MEWAQYGLDVLKVLVWPAVAAGVLIGFRKQIGDRIRKVRSVKSPLGEAEFDPAAEADQLTREIAPKAERLLEGDGDLTAPQVEAPAPDLLQDRYAIEDILQASFRSGFEVGAAGIFDAPPTPLLRWTGTMPEVVGWSAPGSPRSRTSARTWEALELLPSVKRQPEGELKMARIEELQDEIRRIELHSPRNRDGRISPKQKEILASLKAELQPLDPHSPYLKDRITPPGDGKA